MVRRPTVLLSTVGVATVLTLLLRNGGERREGATVAGCSTASASFGLASDDCVVEPPSTGVTPGFGPGGFLQTLLRRNRVRR